MPDGPLVALLDRAGRPSYRIGTLLPCRGQPSNRLRAVAALVRSRYSRSYRGNHPVS